MHGRLDWGSMKMGAVSMEQLLSIILGIIIGIVIFLLATNTFGGTTWLRERFDWLFPDSGSSTPVKAEFMKENEEVVEGTSEVIGKIGEGNDFNEFKEKCERKYVLCESKIPRKFYLHSKGRTSINNISNHCYIG